MAASRRSTKSAKLTFLTPKNAQNAAFFIRVCAGASQIASMIPSRRRFGMEIKMINISFFIRQISLITLLTVGVSLEMIGGVIDLAFAAQLSASALVGVSLIAGGCPVGVGCIGILFFNFCLGFLKAVFLVKLRIPSIIFTLAMQVILSNFLLVTVDYTGIVIPGLQESYRGNLYTVVELIITVFCVAGAFFFLEKTYYGKYCRMLGEDLPLARENGVKCFGISVVVHLFSSFFFSISAAFLMFRTGSSNSALGATYLYQILTAVFLGGILPGTGKGRILGMASGALAVTLGVTFLTGSGYLYRFENILEGSIILVALALGIRKKN